MGFLPMTRDELIQSGISQLDFIIVTGDAYVDHPSFGIAIIGRVLEAAGYTVGIVAQPVSDNDYQRMGEPKYCFLVSGGNIDSMVSNYTVGGKKRNDDAYSPGGKGGRRPDRALNVYCQNLKRLFPQKEIAIGGLEASLRRFAHYDYWSDSVLPSVLVSSGAELLMYGMGELTIRELAAKVSAGKRLREIHDIRGICYLVETKDTPIGAVQCDSFEMCSTNKKSYAVACRKQYDEQDEVYGRTIVQRHGNQMLVQNPPQRSLTQEEFDEVYELPFMKTYHPYYEKFATDTKPGVPAIEEVQFSVTHNRGCFGFCNFCSIALHQGRRIQTRSEQSIVQEVEKMTHQPSFKGYVHDVGGPTANFRTPSCKKQLEKGLCKGKKCHSCKNLEVSHEEYLNLLRRLRKIKKVKKVFIRSGIRYDYLVKDTDKRFLDELVEHHVSGQLKVAPEHSSPKVLDHMGKPHIEVYKDFQEKFYTATKKCGKEQYLVPYLMSSHPGSTIKEAVELAVFLKENNIRPEQVQDFYPTPGTISTAMFYTGLNPYTLEEVYVPRTKEEKQLQRKLLQYYKPENHADVRKALIMAGRRDLIGDRKECLVAADKKAATVRNSTQVNKGKNTRKPPQAVTKGRSKNTNKNTRKRRG